MFSSEATIQLLDVTCLAISVIVEYDACVYHCCGLAQKMTINLSAIRNSTTELTDLMEYIYVL